MKKITIKAVAGIMVTCLLLSGCGKKKVEVPEETNVTEQAAEEKPKVVEVLGDPVEFKDDIESVESPEEPENVTEEDVKPQDKDPEFPEDNEDDTEVIEGAEIKEEKTINHYSKTFTNKAGESYLFEWDVDSSNSEKSKITVTYNNKVYTAVIDGKTLLEVLTIIDYADENRNTYIEQAVKYKVPRDKVDIEGWIGDIVLSLAKGSAKMNNGTTYHDYAIESINEMKEIKNIKVEHVEENETAKEGDKNFEYYDSHGPNGKENEVTVTILPLQYNKCVYVSGVDVCRPASYNSVECDSVYGKYSYFTNEKNVTDKAKIYYKRSLINTELPANDYLDIIGHNEMLKIWNYFTAGAEFPIDLSTRYLVGYSISPTSIAHWQPTGTVESGNILAISIKAGSQGELGSGGGELFVLPLKDTTTAFIPNFENYYK